MMSNRGEGLFFGVGSGRCGTMTMANLLNAEPDALALHEGKLRHREEAGEQLLPFLTLQNYHAYCNPDLAVDMVRKTRGAMEALRERRGVRVLGDIAYNYAPFTAALAKVFPDARLLFFFRDGRDFVRSAYTAQVPDPTPVGWLDPDRPLSKLERYVALGRLRPMPGDVLAGAWDDMTPIEKNAWLWAETNRLILGGVASWPAKRVLRIRFEGFVSAPLDAYGQIRDFLGLTGSMPEAIDSLLERPINARDITVLPRWPDWDQDTADAFYRYAGEMMRTLGYV